MHKNLVANNSLSEKKCVNIDYLLDGTKELNFKNFINNIFYIIPKNIQFNLAYSHFIKLTWIVA
tara:strand:- start:384 stop:575 length:192 start_codon:yes stop_codon:yes gene_type:complete